MTWCLRIQSSEKVNYNYTLYALGEKGMLAKGPDLVLELVKDLSVLKIYVTKGRKAIFHDDILLGKMK
jgi:hypothetical protein